VTTAVPPHLRAAPRGFSWTPLIAAALTAELALTVLLVYAPPAFVLVTAVLIVAVALATAAHFALPAAEREPLLILFGTGLLVRLVVMFVWHYAAISPANPYGLHARDSFGYDGLGWLVAQHWRHGQPPRIEFQLVGLTLGYHFTVAAIYTVAGHVPLLVKTVNVLLSAGLVPLTFLAGRELAGRRAGLTAAFLIAFWPPVVFWSVHILKDTAITFLLLLAALGWIAFARRPRFRTLIAALGPAIPLAFLRSYALVFWIVSLAAGLFFIALRSRRVLPAVALVLAVAAMGWWAATPQGAQWIGVQEDLVAKMSAMGGSTDSVFEHVTYTSLQDILVFLPLGFARFLVTPLPWRVELSSWPEAAGAILRYALLPFAIVGFLHLFRVKRTATIPIVVFGFLTLVLYSVAFRGGIPRHWMQFYPYFLVFAATGLPRWPNWPLPVALGGIAFLVSAIAVTRG